MLILLIESEKSVQRILLLIVIYDTLHCIAKSYCQLIVEPIYGIGIKKSVQSLYLALLSLHYIIHCTNIFLTNHKKVFVIKFIFSIAVISLHYICTNTFSAQQKLSKNRKETLELTFVFHQNFFPIERSLFIPDN